MFGLSGFAIRKISAPDAIQSLTKSRCSLSITSNGMIEATVVRISSRITEVIISPFSHNLWDFLIS